MYVVVWLLYVLCTCVCCVCMLFCNDFVASVCILVYDCRICACVCVIVYDLAMCVRFVNII